MVSYILSTPNLTNCGAFMNRDRYQLKLRIDEDLKEKLDNASKENDRSLNAEIVSRLEKSFSREDRIQKLVLSSMVTHSIIRNDIDRAYDPFFKKNKEKILKKNKEMVSNSLRELNNEFNYFAKEFSKIDPGDDLFFEYGNIYTSLYSAIELLQSDYLDIEELEKKN